MDKKKIVKAGYNKIAHDYLASRSVDSEDVKLLDELVKRLPQGAKILDAGCGAGVPITQYLSQNFNVIGVDFSENQIELARKNVPQAQFLCHDITELDFPDESFDAICSYYAIIHIPRSEHAPLFKSFYRLLKPSGLALLCLGADDLDDDIVEDYLGARMYWSHFDAETNLKLIEAAGFELIWSKVVADASCPGSGHLFVLVQKRAA